MLPIKASVASTHLFHASASKYANKRRVALLLRAFHSPAMPLYRIQFGLAFIFFICGGVFSSRERERRTQWLGVDLRMFGGRVPGICWAGGRAGESVGFILIRTRNGMKAASDKRRQQKHQDKNNQTIMAGMASLRAWRAGSKNINISSKCVEKYQW